MPERQVPGDPEESHARIQERPYDSDFARLPDEETVRDLDPGGGPTGTLDSGPANLPLVVVAVGFAVLFVVFLVEHWLVAAVGLGLIVVGGMWASLRHRGPRRRGTGAATVRVDPEQQPQDTLGEG